MNETLRRVLTDYQAYLADKARERAKEDADWLWLRLHEALRTRAA